MSLRPYRALLSARLRTLLQYRTAALAGIATQLFFGLVRMMIFDAFFRAAGAAGLGGQPMTWTQVNTYIWLGQAFLLLTMAFNDLEIAALVRSGGVVYELVKPADLYALWFSRALSGRLAPLLMRSVPILLIAGFFFGLTPPVSGAAALLFAASIALSLALASAIMVLISTTLFWTLSGEGVSRLVPHLIFMLSGMILPLPLFPDVLQPALAVLPFRGLIDAPFRIWIGDLAGARALAALAHQAAWTLAFILAGRFLLSRGLRRLEAQGG
ncbi:MAG: ABC-2 family transporter protein [Spirochaetes bacterium]|nr:ABC-2 family transporter protein [Spirochaetota bacterium]